MLLNRQKEMPFGDDQDIAKKTEHRLVELLILNSEFSLYALIALVLGFYWLLTRFHGFIWPTVWVVGFVGLLISRAVHMRRFYQRDKSERRYKRTINIYWVAASLTALYWSSLLIFFVQPGTQSYFTFYTLVTVGIACVAISSQAPIPKIYLSFQICLMVPLSAFYLSLGGMENLILGSTIFLLLGFVVVLSSRIRRGTVQSITLELANQKLADTLKHENIKAEKLNKSLLQEIGKREQTEQDLIAAIEEARAASKAKSDFLAVISHEIRTPMNGVMGMLDLVSDTALDKLQRDYLGTASRSAETLLRLLNDLLDFSKCDQGALPLEQSAFLIREAADEVISLMAGRAKKKGLKFNFNWDESVPDWVTGDPVRFRQIIGNLVGNAVKFTFQGEVSLSLVSYKREGETFRFFFKLEDTGVGIETDAIEGLFEPYTQADSSTTRKFRGTGLGLAISRRLIRMMGGEIDVHSSIGEGSTFSFDLVLGEPDAVEIEKSLSSQLQATTEKVYSGRVLVVEDDVVNQRVIRLLLEGLGLDVVVAENGETGFGKAKSGFCDLLFMDCHMPVMDGLTATEKIREHEEANGLSYTNIIALTASAKKSDKDNCLLVGMDDFIAKPVRKLDLITVLDTWLPEAVIVRP